MEGIWAASRATASWATRRWVMCASSFCGCGCLSALPSWFSSWLLHFGFGFGKGRSFRLRFQHHLGVKGCSSDLKKNFPPPLGHLFCVEANEKAPFTKSHLAEKYKLHIGICFCFCLRTHTKCIMLLLFLRNVPDTIFPCCRSDSTSLC